MTQNENRVVIFVLTEETWLEQMTRPGFIQTNKELPKILEYGGPFVCHTPKYSIYLSSNA
jgi:hypothetical protein